MKFCTLFFAIFFAFTTAASAQEQKGRQVTLERILRVHSMANFANMLLIPPNAEIQHFEIACIKANREDIVYHNKTSEFAPQTEAILQASTPGDVFYIDNIIIKEGNTTRKVSSVFKVVDAELKVESTTAPVFLAINTMRDLAKAMNLSVNAEIQSFEINYRESPESEPITFLNTSAELLPETKRLILLAQKGSTYHFKNISLKQNGTLRFLSAFFKIVA
jgi:hypothetical protein